MRIWKKKMWLRKAVLCLAILVGIGGIWFAHVWHRINQTYQQALPVHADVGIVLGAAVWGDGPSPGLRERLDQALWLYREGYVPYLLVSGGLGEAKRVTEAAVMRDYLISHGMPADRILLETNATSTYENLLFSQQVMEQHHMRTALVISHDYHLARAMEMAQSLGMQASPVGVQSHVLFGPYHKTREVLAITYWQLSRFWQSALQTLIFA